MRIVLIRGLTLRSAFEVSNAVNKQNGNRDIGGSDCFICVNHQCDNGRKQGKGDQYD
jgi:hypothetical protein